MRTFLFLFVDVPAAPLSGKVNLQNLTDKFIKFLRNGTKKTYFPVRSRVDNLKRPGKVSDTRPFYMGCGAGGIRTPVQTSSRTAFYMLSHRLIVGRRMARGRPALTVVTLISDAHRNLEQPIPAFLMPLSERRRDGLPGRQVVSDF